MQKQIKNLNQSEKKTFLKMVFFKVMRIHHREVYKYAFSFPMKAINTFVKAELDIQLKKELTIETKNRKQFFFAKNCCRSF